MLPFAEDVLYVFLGQTERLTAADVDRLLAAKFDVESRAKILPVLLWYGVLGVERNNGDVAFIQSVNYDMKRLEALMAGVVPEQRAFHINPAFWPGLEISQEQRLL